MPEEMIVDRQIKARPLLLDGERMNSAIHTGALEITHEKVVPIRRRKTNSWIMNKARRSLPQECDGWYNISRLPRKLQMPELFGIPQTGRRGLTKLISTAPAGVAAFHDIDQSRRVAVIAIVVACE